MLLALGRHLLFRQVFGANGVVLVVAVVATIILVRFWPQISSWIEARLRR